MRIPPQQVPRNSKQDCIVFYSLATCKTSLAVFRAFPLGCSSNDLLTTPFCQIVEISLVISNCLQASCKGLQLFFSIALPTCHAVFTSELTHSKKEAKVLRRCIGPQISQIYINMIIFPLRREPQRNDPLLLADVDRNSSVTPQAALP